MKRLLIFLTATFCALISFGQTAPRFELLTRSATPFTRHGGNALSGAPEISADGGEVLFLSLAGNLVGGLPSRSLNLYLSSRTSGVQLVSVSTNGGLANGDVQNFQFSADGRHILFESLASNLVPNDTNDAVDIFLRDLNTGQTILISADTNGLPAGGFDASMNAAADRVSFASASKKLTSASSSSAINNIFVRYVNESRTVLLTGSSAVPSNIPPASSISEDGRFVAFTAYGSFGLSQMFLRDLNQATNIRTSSALANIAFAPLISADDQLVAYSGNDGGPQIVGVYNIQTGTQMTIRSDSSGAGGFRLMGISTNHETVLYTTPWLPGAEIWQAANSNFFTLPENRSGPVELSANGHFISYMTEQNNSAGASGVTASLYDIPGNAFTAISLAGETAVGDSPSDPSPNGDASLVAFVGKDAGLDGDELPQNNICLWDKSTGESELISKSLTNAVSISQRRGSSHAKRFSVSDDGKRVVYQSLEAVDDRTKTNPVWNVFMFDRVTGQKQVISRSVDGLGGGNKASYGAVISGNGLSVAYFSKSTNLVENPQTGNNAISIIAKDLTTGAVYLANRPTNANYFTMRADNLSWSREGKYLLYTSDFLSGIVPSQNLYLFSIAENRWTLISARSDGRPFQSSITAPFNTAISPDGNYIAFQVVAGSDAGFTGSGLQTLLCGRSGRPFERISSYPVGATSGTSGNARSLLRFTGDSSAIVFGGWTNGISQYYSLATQTVSIAATNCIDADVSDDLRWCAFTRLETVSSTVTRKHIFLRNMATGEETFVTTNANFHSYNPRLTADGRFVIFESRATNLVTNDFNNLPDIFVYDRTRQRLEIVSQTSTGGSGNSASQRPVLSGDSSTIVFKTHASDLFDGDFNEAADLLAYTLPMLKITSYQIVGGKLQLVWDAAPGQTYRIQSRESLTSGDWGDEVSVGGEVEPPVSDARFYRVVQE